MCVTAARHNTHLCKDSGLCWMVILGPVYGFISVSTIQIFKFILHCFVLACCSAQGWYVFKVRNMLEFEYTP